MWLQLNQQTALKKTKTTDRSLALNTLSSSPVRPWARIIGGTNRIVHARPCTSPTSSLVPSSTMSRLLCISILSVLLASVVEPAISSSLQRYESIFSFGASFADTGNGNLVLAGSSITNPAAHPPYGQTFFGHPTGRRSDGRLIIDFVAQQLGLPFLPPSLSHNASFSQGANFAVMGSTALHVGFFRDIPAAHPILNTSSSVQLQWFESLKPSLCSPAQGNHPLPNLYTVWLIILYIHGDSKLAPRFAVCPLELGFFDKSLFFMGEFGTNDYRYYTFSGMTPSQVRSIVPDVVRAIVETTQGATTVVVPGVPPLGCFPPALELFSSADPADYEHRTGCLKEFNDLAAHHNSLLQETLQIVRTNHPNVVLVYADFFTPIIEMVESPRKFGFIQDVLRCCCGGGGRYNFNMSASCGMPAATVCNHPNMYLFWDEHFTEAAYHYVAKGWLDKLKMRNLLMGTTTYS
uniref:Uncharacterized protein n=1 Tax=Avena sativa TaxID=4498 RepID=A0ACD6AH69_AVESA